MARFGKDMMIYASADLLGSLIGLLLSPLFTRLFTPAQYGAQAALAAVWSFVALAQFGGMDSAYPIFRSRTNDGEQRRRLLLTATVVAVFSAVVVSGGFAAVCLTTDWVQCFAGISAGEARAFVLTLVPGALMAWFLYVLRYERRAAAFARVSLLGRVLATLLLVPVLQVTPAAERLGVSFLVTAGATGLAAVLGWVEFNRAGGRERGAVKFDGVEARALLGFGLVLVPGFALYAASAVLDRLLVTWFAGPDETAVLALALRLSLAATMLKTWFGLVWDPQLIDWVAELPLEEVVRRLDRAVCLIALATAVLVALAASWSAPVVAWLYPASYAGTARLLPWIVLGVGLSTLSLVAVATTTLARTPKLHFPVYALGFLANLGVGVWLVPRLGAGGAVLGVLAAETCILGAWIFLGTVRFDNLPLKWVHAWPLVPAALFAVLPASGWMMRSMATLVAFVAFGVPLARRLDELRKAT